MRLQTLLIVAGLLGACSGDLTVDTGGEGGEASALHEQKNSTQPGPYSDHRHGACGTVFQIDHIVTDQGESYVQVPVPCDPYWYDTGDPPPDEMGEHDMGDPSPGMNQSSELKQR